MIDLRQARERLRDLVSPELVQCLEAVFPDTLPDALTDPREIAAKVGQQQVVRYLAQVAREGEQRGNLLTRSVIQGRRPR